eukprot:3745794-Alexandrium_andersonii.AAC.1
MRPGPSADSRRTGMASSPVQGSRGAWDRGQPRSRTRGEARCEWGTQPAALPSSSGTRSGPRGTVPRASATVWRALFWPSRWDAPARGLAGP